MELCRITYSPAALIPLGAESGHTGSQRSEAAFFMLARYTKAPLVAENSEEVVFGESGKNLGEIGKRGGGRQTTLPHSG